jgi:hypothetical protein
MWYGYAFEAIYIVLGTVLIFAIEPICFLLVPIPSPTNLPMTGSPIR